MRTKNKILLGVVALAMPFATMASFGPAAGAAKPPPNPVTCDFSATVTLTPPLSVAGEAAPKGSNGTAAVAATYSSCHTATASVGPFHQTINIEFAASKPGKDSAAMSAGDNKKDYYLGLCGSFASSDTVKDLKKAIKNLPFQGGILKGGKAAEGTVGPDVGFTVSGTVKGGSYPTASKAASLDAGLTNDTNNTNLINGCPDGPVNHIDIDSSNSSATL